MSREFLVRYVKVAEQLHRCVIEMIEIRQEQRGGVVPLPGFLPEQMMSRLQEVAPSERLEEVDLSKLRTELEDLLNDEWAYQNSSQFLEESTDEYLQQLWAIQLQLQKVLVLLISLEEIDR